MKRTLLFILLFLAMLPLAVSVAVEAKTTGASSSSSGTVITTEFIDYRILSEKTRRWKC